MYIYIAKTWYTRCRILWGLFVCRGDVEDGKNGGERARERGRNRKNGLMNNAELEWQSVCGY